MAQTFDIAISNPPDAQVDAEGDPTMVEHVRGEAVAPVTVLEYGDYECPYCAAAAPVLRDLVDQSEGRIRLVFRNFPLFEVHPHALVAALAAESTTASGHFWEMHYLLFEQQARLTEFDLRKYALHVGSAPDLATGEAAQRFAAKVQVLMWAIRFASVSISPSVRSACATCAENQSGGIVPSRIRKP